MILWALRWYLAFPISDRDLASMLSDRGVEVEGAWTCLYRGVHSLGQTIDFLLSARRNATAAKRFFRKALRRPHTVNPRTITVDNNAALPERG